MTIEPSIAKEIVTQLAETIGQNINFMNADGIIIASSDASREGKLHYGARELIQKQLPLLVIDDDTQYEGARNGVNLPILFENELVGTIGITGEVSEVLKYGQIIKRMTEILLLDNRIREKTVIEQKARDRFYDEWILNELESRNAAEFQRMAEALSIDTNAPVRIAVLSMEFGKIASDDTYTAISRLIRQKLKSRLSGSAFRTATKMICIINEANKDCIIPTFQELANTIRSNYECNIHMGITNTPATFHLHESYLQALSALEIAKRRNSLLVVYDEYDFDFVMQKIPEETCRRYLLKLFGQLNDSTVQKLQFVQIYLEENGSLNAISNRLYLHKNTVKYRISKLCEQTGVDIRTCHGAYIFSLALNLWHRLDHF